MVVFLIINVSLYRLRLFNVPIRLHRSAKNENEGADSIPFFEHVIITMYNMKTKNAIGVFMPFAVIMMLLSGCIGESKKKQEVVKVQPVMEIPDIVEAIGKIGDGTSMNVLELVDDNGDTLLINMPVSTITGGVESGDIIDVIYTASSGGDMTASVAVNLTALQHLWTQSRR